MVVVPDAKATSFEGCNSGTRVVTQQVHLTLLADDESVCVLSDQGAWAAFKFTESGIDYLVLDMAIFPPL